MAQPIIGLTSDYSQTPGYSRNPYYALRRNYVEVVSDFGATPIVLPFAIDDVARYAEIIDGLLLAPSSSSCEAFFF